ncbi:DMT family transporter [Rhizobium sp. Root482]|uniref:DMT family transporter n=1 Tax=Rhizobium sp. Root482 TaxID=1736543 RepID=UPI0006F6A250|nr:DMT family transporter [Rhizobium sp. Root482]KQY12314.1 hypothetical protein ASD31_17300 [Rhizobium sp. Root482]
MINQANPTAGSRSVLGIILMCIAMFVVPLADVGAKILVQKGVSPLQTVFLRMLFGTILLLPLVRIYNPRALGKVAQPLPVLVLGLSIVGATTFFFLSLEFLAIADALAITFIQPFLVTILSKYFLKEHVSTWRWLTVAIGFAATLIIIRPSSDAFEPASILPLLSGAFMALYAITVRTTTRSNSALTTTFYTHAAATVVAAPLMFFAWDAMDRGSWLLIGELTLLGLAVQFLIIKAYEFGEASLIAPLSYTEIVSSTLAGLWFFNEFPDRATFVGVAILIGCAIFTSYQTATQTIAVKAKER